MRFKCSHFFSNMIKICVVYLFNVTRTGYSQCNHKVINLKKPCKLVYNIIFYSSPNLITTVV